MSLSNPSRIFLNSNERQANDQPHDFTINLDATIENIKDMEVLELQVPFLPVYPNFTPRTGIFTCNVAGTGDVVVELTATQLTFQFGNTADLITEWNTAISSAMTAAGLPANTLVLSADTNPTGKLVWTNNGGNNITFSNVLPDATIVASYPALKKLGFDTDLASLTIAGGATYLTPNPAYVLRSSVLYVSTNFSDDSITDKEGVLNVLHQIFVANGQYGSILHFESKTDESKIAPLNSAIRNIHIEILDEDFEPFEICNNAPPVVMEIHAEYKNEEFDTGKGDYHKLQSYGIAGRR